MIFVCKQLTHHAKQPHRVTRLIYFKKIPWNFSFFFFSIFFCFVFVCSSVTHIQGPKNTIRTKQLSPEASLFLRSLPPWCHGVQCTLSISPTTNETYIYHFDTSWQAWQPELRLCQRVNISVFFPLTKQVFLFVTISLTEYIKDRSKPTFTIFSNLLVIIYLFFIFFFVST